MLGGENVPSAPENQRLPLVSLGLGWDGRLPYGLINSPVPIYTPEKREAL